MEQPILRADIIILGGGLVGLTLAIALDAHGVSSIVIDPADPETQLSTRFDGRASAIASASWKMLDAIGVAEYLTGKGCAIRHIRVSDGLASGALDFMPDPEDGPLGIMFENRALRIALRARALAAKHITLLMPSRAVHVERGAHNVHIQLEDGGCVEAPLVIAAEGRNSPMRDAAGIKVARWKYDHNAIIAAISHEHDHNNIAYEIFYPAGPFAILPMIDDELGRHRSAVVWTVKSSDQSAMLALSDRAFLAEASKKMGGFLGTLTAIAPRTSFPLGFHHTAKITSERLALVGDAAHGIHPIAGQGLNLGFRDVAALTEILVEGVRLGLGTGDAQLLARYERWRSLDTLMVATATDSLTRLFGMPGKTAARVRRFGLGTVQRISPLKNLFMAEARGETGNLPRLLQGVSI